MARRKRPSQDMTDREVFESIFPKRVREKVREQVELDDDPKGSEDAEAPENAEENDSERPSMESLREGRSCVKGIK